MKTNKLIISILALVISFNLTFAGEGGMVGNGGGKSEANITHAFSSYAKYINMVLKRSIINFSDDEIQILEKILSSEKEGIRFENLGENYPAFTTKKTLGALIVFNSDQLVKIDFLGNEEPLSLSDALDILTLSFCSQFNSSIVCEALSSKVKIYSSVLIETMNFSNYNQEYVEFYLINKTEIQLTDGDFFYNLTKMINRQALCFDTPQVAQEVKIINIYQDQFGVLNLSDFIQDVTIKANISYNCGGISYQGALKYIIPFEIYGPRSSLESIDWWKYDVFSMKIINDFNISYERLRQSW